MLDGRGAVLSLIVGVGLLSFAGCTSEEEDAIAQKTLDRAFADVDWPTGAIMVSRTRGGHIGVMQQDQSPFQDRVYEVTDVRPSLIQDIKIQV